MDEFLWCFERLKKRWEVENKTTHFFSFSHLNFFLLSLSLLLSSINIKKPAKGEKKIQEECLHEEWGKWPCPQLDMVYILCDYICSYFKSTFLFTWMKTLFFCVVNEMRWLTSRSDLSALWAGRELRYRLSVFNNSNFFSLFLSLSVILCFMSVFSIEEVHSSIFFLSKSK